jgi:hypothetical protein
MSQLQDLRGGGVRLLPPGTGSLACGVPPAPAGTLFTLGERGGVCVAPPSRFTVLFGRGELDVHVCVGVDDQAVSRRHGMLRHDGWRWTLANTGWLPIRLPDSQLLLRGHQHPLPVAYTPVFIRSCCGREHLLEIRITGPAPNRFSGVQPHDTTCRRTWKGAVALRGVGAPEIVNRGWSHHQGQLVEGSQDS